MGLATALKQYTTQLSQKAMEKIFADEQRAQKVAEAIGRAQARMMKTLRSTLVRLRTQDIEEIGLEASLRQLVSEHNLQTASRSVFQLSVDGQIAALPRPVY